MSDPLPTAVPQAKPSTLSEVLSFFKTIAILITLVVAIRGTLMEPFKIPSGSMIPTLQIGDRILVSKLSYGIRIPILETFAYRSSSPQRGEIVVFTRPDEPDSREDESSINLIKRIVAVGGDKVEVKNATLFINDRAVKEDYARWTDGGPEYGDFGPETVPEGHLFMLGDNRDHSKDSRFWDKPFLDSSRVKGRALIVYWNFDNLSRIFTTIK
jgi:signal peptidase I